MYVLLCSPSSALSMHIARSYLSESNSLICFSCSKCPDMSVARTMSITNPRTIVNSSRLKLCRILNSSCTNSMEWSHQLISQMCNVINPHIDYTPVPYFSQQFEGIMQMVVLQYWSVIVAQGKVGAERWTINCTWYLQDDTLLFGTHCVLTWNALVVPGWSTSCMIAASSKASTSKLLNHTCKDISEKQRSQGFHTLNAWAAKLLTSSSRAEHIRAWTVCRTSAPWVSLW